MKENWLNRLLAYIVNLKAVFQRVSNDAPDHAVRHYAESFFAPIRYSSELGQAKNAVIAALEPVYEELKREDEGGAFQTLVARYPDLEALLEAAGIDKAYAETIRRYYASQQH